MQLDIAMEGVLFYKASAIKKSDLLKLFNCSPEELSQGLAYLKERLKAGATRLIETENQVQLVTAPELDDFIELIRKDDLKRDIGKAGAETLAIILYKGPVSRAEIDRVRGVNSSFILRNLLIRGLIERSPDSKNFSFNVTPDLMASLGITNKLDLPNYASILDQLEKFEQNEAKAEQATTS